MKRLSLNKTAACLRSHRKDARVSVKALASALQVSQQSIYFWEKGEKIPTIDHLAELADLYSCKIDDLIVMEEI